jgi:hypothetical protein
MVGEATPDNEPQPSIIPLAFATSAGGKISIGIAYKRPRHPIFKKTPTIKQRRHTLSDGVMHA